MGHWLRDTSPEGVDVDGMLADERFVYGDGSVLLADDAYRPHTFVWFHRDLREEPEVPGEIAVLHRDERLVVVDKPPFLSTIPRGRHVRQSVTVRLRDELGLPELSPLHRLDRVTSGVLLLVVWAAAGREALGWFLVAVALTPVADAVIVLTHGGRLSTALGVHGLTAALLVAAGLVLALA